MTFRITCWSSIIIYNAWSERVLRKYLYIVKWSQAISGTDGSNLETRRQRSEALVISNEVKCQLSVRWVSNRITWEVKFSRKGRVATVHRDWRKISPEHPCESRRISAGHFYDASMGTSSCPCHRIATKFTCPEFLERMIMNVANRISALGDNGLNLFALPSATVLKLPTLSLSFTWSW